MRTELVYYILLLLDAENSVRIPGVGILTRHVKPAKVYKKAWIVTPPQSTLHFTPSQRKKGKLLSRFIAYKSDVSTDNASSYVEEFGEAITELLNQTGKATIKHLGEFYKKEDDILFTPDVMTSNAAYLGLRTISLPERAILGEEEVTKVSEDHLQPQEEELNEGFIESSIVAGIVTEEAKEIEITPAPNTKVEEERSHRRIPVLLPVLFLIFIGVASLALMQYNSRSAIYHPVSSYNRAPTTDSALSDEVFVNKYKATPENKVQDEVIGDAVLENTESDLTPKSTDLLVTEEIKEEPIEDIDVSSLSNDEEVEVVIPEAKLSNELSSECYVVVGAFGVQSNVERMLNRLTEMGYVTVTMPRNNLTQIGVSAPCGSPEIEQALSDLQATVESEAWIFNK